MADHKVVRKSTIWAVLAGSVTAVVVFFITGIVALNLLADPGNMDTGMAAVFGTPLYCLAGLVAGVLAFVWVRRRG